jgi:glycosyltransferase involved in cell wall biosynthesis
MMVSAKGTARDRPTTGRARRVAFIVNSDRAFLTHRASWADALRETGYEPYVLAPDTGYAQEIEALGFRFIKLDLGREDIRPVDGVLAALKILVTLIRLRPRLVFLVQTAAYTLGWPAAYLLPRSKFIRVAGGVGRALGLGAAAESRSAKIVRMALRASSRRRNVFSLFQIEGDRQRFVGMRLAEASRSWVIPGTGIDLEIWTAPERDYSGEIVLGFASRLYEEKGVREFAEAADRLRAPGLRFVIVGAPDAGVSTSIPDAQLRSWVADGRLEWWGYQDNMADVFRRFDLLVFPSRHPEGTPRTLLEAAACGVPAVASDQEGCRAVILDGKTGWILDSPSADSITSLLHDVLADRKSLAAASHAARTEAETRFSLDSTLSALFDALELPARSPEPQRERVEEARRG